MCVCPTHADVAAIKANPFAEPGSHSQWRESVSTVDERVDPFGGSLQLSYVDLVVPGNGGLDIRIQRHYTSNIWLTRPGNLFSVPPFPKAPLEDGPAGLGWTLDVGRVVRSERDPGIGSGIDHHRPFSNRYQYQREGISTLFRHHPLIPVCTK